MFMGPCIVNRCQWLSNKMRLYTVYYVSANCSTYFGWYLHPSSGAHVNCNYSIWHWSNRICYFPLTWKIWNSVPNPPHQRTVTNTVRPVPDAVIIIYMCSWWWVKVSPETCRVVCRKYNKTVYIRILLDNYWHWPQNFKDPCSKQCLHITVLVKI